MTRKTTLDTDKLEYIPEEHRENATSYTAEVSYYNKSDESHGMIPEGKKVGDVHIEAHTRYTVTYDE